VSEREEDPLREAFESLRLRDGRMVPPFERVWATAEARAAHAPRRTMGPRFSWGVLLAAAAVVALLIARGGRQAPSLALANWRAPTEFLLQSPTDAMLRSVPPLSASVIELQPVGRGRATQPQRIGSDS